MTQEIKIGVSAQTGGAEGGINKVENAAAGAAEAVSGIAAASREATVDLGRLTQQAEALAKASEKIERTRRTLAGMGYKLDVPDTAHFLSNFDRIKAGEVGGIGARRVRESSGFDDWFNNQSTRFTSQRDIDRHRQLIVQRSLQGTGYQPPAPGNPGGGGGGGGSPAPGGGQGGGMVQRAKSSAMGFGKTLLGLAGVGSLIGMAGKSADLYTQEAVGTDTLKRRAGDLGVSFEKLQQQTRAAGDGLGVTYIESVKLAQQYAKITGNYKNADGVRTSEGFSRSFGLDPSTGVQFFAAMQKIKAPGSDDQGSKKLALMIGEAVVKGGYGGKADEVMEAVSGLAETMTRNTLAAPNVSAIAGYLTTLTKSGFPGLDPQGAAALLGQADASVRRGGGMGDASLNFSYAALSRGSPGLGVVGAGALWQAGLFGTTRGVFGKGKDGKYNSPVGEWYAKNGLATPGLDDTTNLSKEMSLLHKQYSGKGKAYLLDAIKNQFGVNYAQAAALDLMNSSGATTLTDSANLVGKAGLDMSKLSASGYQGIARVANAKSRNELNAVYGDVMGRKDLTDGERKDLGEAFKKGGETLQIALVKALGTHEQEKTDGSETRQSIANLQDALTNVGKDVVAILNPIRNAVEALAEQLAPEKWKQGKQDEKDKGKNFSAEATAQRRAGMFGRSPERQMAGIYKGAVDQYHAEGGGYAAANRIAPKPTYLEARDPAHYAAAMAKYNLLHNLAAAESVGISAEQRAAIDKAAGGDKAKATFLENVLRIENRGRKAPVDATSPKGAQGYMQFMPKTWAATGGGDIHDFATNMRNGGRLYDDLKKRYGGDRMAMYADYNGSPSEGARIHAGLGSRTQENRDYVNMAAAMDGTPLPAGDPAGKLAAANTKVHVTVGGESHVIVKDANGKVHGVASIKPWVNNSPSGVQPWVGGMSK